MSNAAAANSSSVNTHVNDDTTGNGAANSRNHNQNTGSANRTLPELLSATLRLCHTVAEGGCEALMNLATNVAEAVPLPPRLPGAAAHKQNGHRTARERYLEDLSGKVAIVTGGNAGIGFATAKQLARRGAHVVLACRDKARAEAAVQAISAAPPLPGCLPGPAAALHVEAAELDLGRLSSVRRFAEQWAARGLPLHLLVCNAGVMAPLTRTATEDGLEVQFQVNFLSHWLLTHLLVESERSRRRRTENEPQQWQGGASRVGSGGGPGGASDNGGGGGSGAGGDGRSGGLEGLRVVVVSSVVHRVGALQWGDMLSERSYEPYITYGLSKLATVMFAKELQRRFERNPEYGRHDAAVAIHPGLVRTHLANNFFRSYGLSWLSGTPLEPLGRLWCGFLDTAGQSLLSTPDQAADRMLHACLAPSQHVVGQYLALGRVYAPDKMADDPALAMELWDTASRLTGYKPGGTLA